MSQIPTTSFELRAAAMRMVAAAEYFKAAGHLPSWAQAELASWGSSDAEAPEPRTPVFAAS
jgi:hypothetical protein